MNDLMKKIINKLRKKRIKLIPLKQSEVNSLEVHFKIKFPDVYKEFLLSMGKGAGMFMQDSSVFDNELLYLREWAEELLEENNFRSLPENAFVFWMHQGYQFAYFLVDGENNPVVYFFSEGENPPSAGARLYRVP